MTTRSAWVIDLPFTEGSATLGLLDADALDPWTGSPTMDGLVATLDALSD